MPGQLSLKVEGLPQSSPWRWGSEGQQWQAMDTESVMRTSELLLHNSSPQNPGREERRQGPGNKDGGHRQATPVSLDKTLANHGPPLDSATVETSPTHESVTWSSGRGKSQRPTGKLRRRLGIGRPASSFRSAASSLCVWSKPLNLCGPHVSSVKWNNTSWETFEGNARCCAHRLSSFLGPTSNPDNSDLCLPRPPRHAEPRFQ